MPGIPVLHFLNTLARGGVEEHVVTLLRGLDRRAFQCHLVAPPAIAANLRTELPRDVEVLPLLLRRPRDLGPAVRLARILRERRIQILHSHQFYGSLFASPVGRVCRVPVVIETPHLRESWRTGWFKSRYFIDRLAGRCVDRYIAVSEANARYLVHEKGLPSHKVNVIYNGCDLERFRSPRVADLQLKRSLGFSDDAPVLMTVGRLEPQKGHQVLLNAMVRILHDCPAARLVCLGEGALREALQAHAQALGIAGAVRWVGFQRNVPDWLAIADLTVLPSFYEGLPLAAIESLATARPVVATAVDGTPEVVRDGRTGLLVPPGDVPGLAAAVCRLLCDQETRRRLGVAGRAWVFERFSQERQVRETQALYFDALERAGRVRTRDGRLFGAPALR